MMDDRLIIDEGRRAAEYRRGWDDGWDKGHADFADYQEALIPLLEHLGLADALMDRGFRFIPQPYGFFVEWDRVERGADGQIRYDGDLPAHQHMRTLVTLETGSVPASTKGQGPV